MKPYTITKLDDTFWVLEIEDEALGEHVKQAIAKTPPDVKVLRFGVGINTPLRIFKVKEDDILSVEKYLESYIRRHRG